MFMFNLLRRLTPAVLIGAGIAVALTAGVADAATGGHLILGKANYAGAPTSLSNTGSGVALKLHTKSGTTPNLAVSNSARVPHLNADLLDGLNSTSFQQVATGKLALTPDAAAPQFALLGVPGLGTFKASCSATDANLFFIKSGTVAEVDLVSERIFDPPGNGPTDAVDTLSTFAATAAQTQFASAAGAGSKARYTIQLTRAGARVYTATITLTSQDDNVAFGKCLAWGTLD